MRFQNPDILNFLWAVIPLIVLLVFLARRRQRLLERYARGHLLSEIVLHRNRRRERWINGLLAGMFVFSVVALARPQWGFEWREIKQQALDLIIVLDTSRSMLTPDVKPNRLERAKLAVKDLIKKMKGDRIGLIAFAGDAFLVCPLTVDYAGFMLSLNDVGTATVPRGGTNLAAALKEAMREYDQTPSQYKVVVILTDGDNLEGDPLRAAKEAKEKGIKVYCVGMGTPEGELVQAANALGGKEFVKDENGNIVKSRLNEKILQDIALTTGGVYVRASGAQLGLDMIYEQQLSRLERRELKSRMEQRFYERYQLPLAAALLMLVLATGSTAYQPGRKAGPE